MDNLKSLLCFTLLSVVLTADASTTNSTCFGSTSSGSIKNAVPMPRKGSNFQVFSQLAWYLGRVYVHSDVNRIILKTYADLAKKIPNHKFVYGETGWSNGGSFKPHKTHQNGLSVDFMVPTMKGEGNSIAFTMNMANKWGYEVDFDAAGNFATFAIDFEAMAWHLRLLFEHSQDMGFDIQRVFFDPQLQPLLFATENGPFIKANIKFNQRQAWVRHDDHYHVDFKIPCQ